MGHRGTHLTHSTLAPDFLLSVAQVGSFRHISTLDVSADIVFDPDYCQSLNERAPLRSSADSLAIQILVASWLD